MPKAKPKSKDRVLKGWRQIAEFLGARPSLWRNDGRNQHAGDKPEEGSKVLSREVIYSQSARFCEWHIRAGNGGIQASVRFLARQFSNTQAGSEAFAKFSALLLFSMGLRIS